MAQRERTLDEMRNRDPYLRIAQAIAPGARVRGHRPLAGGVSAAVNQLEIQLEDGATRKVVVRRHRDLHWKSHEDDVTAAEYALLGQLHRAGLPVPKPLILDADGQFFPTPCLVMEFVEGSSEVPLRLLDDALFQMATLLTRLHGLDPDALTLPNLPRCIDPVTNTLRHLPDHPNRAALHRQATAAPRAQVLIHGDFWPGNLLWRKGRCVGLIDGRTRL